jgi:hypothetical protein
MASMSVLREYFHNTSSLVAVIFHGLFVHLWSLRLWLHLWGYLKSNVFISRPRTIEKLKHRIEEEIAAIPEQMTRRVMENLRGSLEQCLKNGGRYLSDVLCET